MEQANKVVIKELSQSESLAHLADGNFGRIAVVKAGKPDIFPVNYFSRDGRIIIRTDPGTKLEAASWGSVAFEVDSIDEESRTAWSVVVKGVGYEVTDVLDDVSEHIRRSFVELWAPGPKEHWIRIEPSSITGRRIEPA